MEQYSSGTGALDRARTLISGMRLLRDGLKLYLISNLVFVFGMLVTTILIILIIGMSGPPGFIGPDKINEMMAGIGIGVLIILFLIFLVSIVLSIMSLVKIKDGMETLSVEYRDISIGVTGAKLMYYGAIIMGISLLLVITLIGIIGMMIAALIIIVGTILWGLGIINLDKYTREDLKTPAIIYIIGILLGLLGLGIIGFIVGLVGIYQMYSRIGYEIEVLERQPVPPSQEQQSREWSWKYKGPHTFTAPLKYPGRLAFLKCGGF